MPLNGYRNVQKTSSVFLNLFPGVTYAVSNRFHLEASINNLLTLRYAKQSGETANSTGKTKSESNNVSLDANVSTSAL